LNAIKAIALTTVGEAVRRRVLLIILMIGVLLLSIIPSLGVLSARSETSTMISTMYFVLRFTSALIASFSPLHDPERDRAQDDLHDPEQAGSTLAILLGKYFGAVFALLLMIVLMTVVMVALFAVFQHSGRLKACRFFSSSRSSTSLRCACLRPWLCSSRPLRRPW